MQTSRILGVCVKAVDCLNLSANNYFAVWLSRWRFEQIAVVGNENDDSVRRIRMNQTKRNCARRAQNEALLPRGVASFCHRSMNYQSAAVSRVPIGIGADGI